MDADKVFKALGDPTRRKLLDLLCEQNTTRRGREKLHFINPVPLHDIYERWVRKFELQRLTLLHDLKRELEGKP